MQSSRPPPPPPMFSAPNAIAAAHPGMQSAVGQPLPGPLPAGEPLQATPNPTLPSIPPNETLYVNNLNDKVNPEEVKKHLRSIFKQFGEIRDIVAMKSFWRRGQAWIIFRDKETATRAMNGLQGFPLYDKPMRINFAIAKSDLIAQEDGTFVSREKGPKKPRAIREREEKQKALFEQLQKQFLEQMQQQMNTSLLPGKAAAGGGVAGLAAGAPVGSAAAAVMGALGSAVGRQAVVLPSFRTSGFSNGGGVAASGAPALPNRTLFIESLPEECSEGLVENIFRVYPGFIEARIIQGRRIAFVDYETAAQSTMALQANQGADLRGNKLRITFAK